MQSADAADDHSGRCVGYVLIAERGLKPKLGFRFRKRCETGNSTTSSFGHDGTNMLLNYTCLIDVSTPALQWLVTKVQKKLTKAFPQYVNGFPFYWYKYLFTCSVVCLKSVFVLCVNMTVSEF